MEISSEIRKPSLIGMTRAELSAALCALGVPDKQLRMRVNQIWGWLYAHGVREFDQMSNVAKDLRERLAAHYSLARLELADAQHSNDGTRKYLFRLDDGQLVETVYIPELDRGTLCVSSQVGCTLTCRFCHTGTQKLVRNLTAAEITGQMVAARDDLQDWGTAGPSNSGTRKVTNMVMMGMGEPLYNSDHVADALNVMSDGDGLSLSKRRITLSTSGVVPEILPMGEKTGVMLAISLHAVTDELRDELVPLNKKYPIAELLEACRNWPGLSNAKRITFEYVMLKDVNDSDDDARALVKLLAGIPAKINLIPFNPWPGAPYQCSDDRRMQAFADIVNRAGYASPVRRPRGRDIMAACGQLKSASVKQSAAEKKKAELAQRNLGR
ncbi:MAG: 23S rRNA (adenine(2503)-C(2))-methyltransferase RlmN [Parvibaculales bacterium]